MKKYIIITFLILFSTSSFSAGIFNDEKIKDFCGKYPKDEICVSLSSLDQDEANYLKKKQKILEKLSNRTKQLKQDFQDIQPILNQIEENKNNSNNSQ